MQLLLRQSQPISTAPGDYPRFFHYPGSPRNTEVQYLGTAWANAESPLVALEARLDQLGGVNRIIIANEAFQPTTGRLRRSAPYRNFGESLWIENVAQVARSRIPDTELWICEFRPRDLRMWSGVREYVRRFPCINGIGIQIHASLAPGVPDAFASPQNASALIRYHCTMIRHLGLQVAFSEVTCWSNNEFSRGRWYRKLIELAKDERIDWLTLWSPTPADAWHWKENPPPPCWLWDEQGRWGWDDWTI